MTRAAGIQGTEERDPLTGLPGLEAARRKLDGWVGKTPVHGLLVGLSRLSAVNLAYGDRAGDTVIAETALRVVQFAGAEFDGPWFAARLGGATLLLLAQEPLSRERWELLGKGLVEAIARPIPTARATLRPSPRVALLRGAPGERADSLLDRLGQTMAVLEHATGRRLLWADGAVVRPGHSAARLEADLLKAIDRNEIEVLFQPQFALSPDQPNGPLTGAEALARWHHPRLGRIGAGALFAIAERADHVVPLSACIARRALATAAAWPPGLRLSLNITSSDLAAVATAGHLLEAVAASGFAPERLTVEVTEQALIGDIATARTQLEALAANGIRIALDDFGAGFCNFRYLKLLPLHYLKLDRTMVDGIAQDGRDLAVFRAIVAMARALGLDVIAEGIEDEAQQAVAAREGCAAMQGFLRARPMRADDFLRFAEG